MTGKGFVRGASAGSKRAGTAVLESLDDGSLTVTIEPDNATDEAGKF